MKTIDNLLADIVRLGVGKLDNSVPLRDKKILVSLDKQINFGNFLTKNQGDLLIKIIKENENSFKKFLHMYGQSAAVSSYCHRSVPGNQNLSRFVGRP